MSLLIIPYPTLSPRLERKILSFDKFKISSPAPDLLSHLITSCHSSSHLIPSYPLGWKEKYFHLTTIKLVPRLQIFYRSLSRLVTPYHTLSLRFERKLFYVSNFKISYHAQDFFITSSQFVLIDEWRNDSLCCEDTERILQGYDLFILLLFYCNYSTLQ